MERRTNTKQLKWAGQALTKTVIIYCLLPLLLFILPIAGLVPSSKTDSLPPGNHVGSFLLNANHFFQEAHYSYHLPFRAQQVEGELEITEEEEYSYSISGPRLLPPADRTSIERHITNLIRNKLLIANSSLDDLEKLPLFVVHHSWKAFLS